MVSHCKGRNECIFECPDCAFCHIERVIVRLNHLELAIFLGKELFYVFCCLIIHHIRFWPEPLFCKLVKISFVLCIEYAAIVQTSYWHGHDSICLIMVHNQKNKHLH